MLEIMKNFRFYAIFFFACHFLDSKLLYADQDPMKDLILGDNIKYETIGIQEIKFTSPVIQLKIEFDEEGYVKKIIPSSDNEKLLVYLKLIVIEKISLDEITLDDGWHIHKSLDGNNKQTLMSFVGALSNMQLARPDAKGFNTQLNGEFMNDYTKLMDLTQDELAGNFSKKSADGNNNLILDIRKIFLSW